MGNQITLQDAFDKLTDSQKEMFHSMLKKYNGVPNVLQIISEINNAKSEEDNKFYKSLFLVSVLFHMAQEKQKEKEDGKEHRYEVAMLCGGVMEDPDFHYEDLQIITAKSEKEAKEKYNKLNNCSYYYGEVLGMID